MAGGTHLKCGRCDKGFYCIGIELVGQTPNDGAWCPTAFRPIRRTPAVVELIESSKATPRRTSRELADATIDLSLQRTREKLIEWDRANPQVALYRNLWK